MADNNIIEKLNQYLLNTEDLAEDFIPFKGTFESIKNDLDTTLKELKKMSEDSEELSDKVFYLNRYADLVKKVDGVFDARIKRIQNSLNILSKLTLTKDLGSAPSSTTNEEDNNEDKQALTPEQCAKIFAIIAENNEK